jgi:hypothetical protein
LRNERPKYLPGPNEKKKNKRNRREKRRSCVRLAAILKLDDVGRGDVGKNALHTGNQAENNRYDVDHEVKPHRLSLQALIEITTPDLRGLVVRGHALKKRRTDRPIIGLWTGEGKELRTVDCETVLTARRTIRHGHNQRA